MTERQTETQTDRPRDRNYYDSQDRASIAASRGKNSKKITIRLDARESLSLQFMSRFFRYFQKEQPLVSTFSMPNGHQTYLLMRPNKLGTFVAPNTFRPDVVLVNSFNLTSFGFVCFVYCSLLIITRQAISWKVCLRVRNDLYRDQPTTLCLKNRTPETFYYNFAKIALISRKISTHNMHMM